MSEGDHEERKKQLFECFNERAIHLNEEGLVVKDLYGHYMVCTFCCAGVVLVSVWLMPCQGGGGGGTTKVP